MTMRLTWPDPAVDELTVELCADGEIPLGKLTSAEKEAVVRLLTDKGLSPAAIVDRTHGSRASVNNALTRLRHRDAS